MKFRKKPVVIEAVQWFKIGDHPKVERPWSKRSDYRCPQCSGSWGRHGVVRTREDSQDGGHFVCPGDWIITGVQGEHYACKPDIFAATYEPANIAPPEAGTRTTGSRAVELLELIVGEWDEEQSKRTQSIADEPWHVQQARKLLNERPTPQLVQPCPECDRLTKFEDCREPGCPMMKVSNAAEGKA